MGIRADHKAGVLMVSRRALIASCAILALSRTAAADEPPVGFLAVMSADEETHVSESPGAGQAAFELDRQTLRLRWRVTFDKLSGPATAAFVHGPERVGGDAPTFIDLAPKSKAPPLAGSVIITDAQLAYLLAGRAYVNIATAKYPKGEIRGQIQRVPDSPMQQDHAGGREGIGR